MYTKSMENLPKWMRAGLFFLHKDLDSTGDSSETEDLDEEAIRKRLHSYKIAPPSMANLISSKHPIVKDLHFPIIDIDFEAQLIESSTPGHYHLYLEHPMTHEKYGELLDALKDAGIIQQGIVNQFKRLGATMARLPWVSKEQHAPYDTIQ